MKTPKYSHNKLNDPTASADELEIAYDLAHQAATEQGYNADNHPLVNKLAERALKARELQNKVNEAEKIAEGWETVKRLEAAERAIKLPPVTERPPLDHVAAVGRGLKNTPKEIPYVMDTKTDLVLTPTDIEQRSQ